MMLQILCNLHSTLAEHGYGHHALNIVLMLAQNVHDQNNFSSNKRLYPLDQVKEHTLSGKLEGLNGNCQHKLHPSSQT